MDIALLGRKWGMSQIFLSDGTCKGVTVVKVDQQVVVDKRTPARDGYAALVLGLDTVTGDPRRVERLVGKPMMGRFKKLGVEPVKVLREFRVKADMLDKFTVGQKVGVELIKEGDRVDVSGISKGHGFAGVMKRHHMAGGVMSHGTHEYKRHGGSIGCRAEPGRVHKGKRMAGHMGAERITTQYLNVAKVIPEHNMVLLEGPVPGYNTGTVEVRPTTKLHPVRVRREEQVSKDPLKASKKAAGGGAKKK
jgi:large subunit ribosomal protein L3